MMEVQNIKIDLISPSPLNPRKTFDQAALEELASNIEKQGLFGKSSPSCPLSSNSN